MTVSLAPAAAEGQWYVQARSVSGVLEQDVFWHGGGVDGEQIGWCFGWVWNTAGWT